MRFAISPLHLSKVLRLPRKSQARSYEVLHLSRKIILENLKIWCTKTQPLSGNQRPDLTRNASSQTPFKCPRPANVIETATKSPPFCSLLKRCRIPCACQLPDETTSERPKVLRTRQFLTLLTSKRASRHNGVHLFIISTSRIGPNMWLFAHFDFEMCFAPQWHALFRHLNFQKCSDVEVFCTCWLRNVLRATTACNFSSLVSPDGSAPAALTSLLFDPPEPPIIGKTQCFATFLPFCAPACSFFWLFLFSDLLSPSLFFSDSSHLCFSSLHIVARCRKLDF